MSTSSLEPPRASAYIELHEKELAHCTDNIYIFRDSSLCMIHINKLKVSSEKRAEATHLLDFASLE